MKNFIVFLSALLLATSAWAGSATTFVYGPDQDVRLAKSQNTTFATTAFCFDWSEDVTASIAGEACGNDDVNELVWPKNAQVRSAKLTQVITGDAGDICDFELEIGGTEVATFNAPTAAAQTVTSYDLVYNIADGDLVGISANTGTSCMTTATPEFIIELWGSWVSDDAF